MKSITSSIALGVALLFGPFARAAETKLQVTTFAGTGEKGYAGDGGPAKDATLSGPKGVAVAPDGNVYLADTESHSVRMIDARKGTIELVAGTGEQGDGPDGDSLGCRMNRLHGIFVDADGAIFVGDTSNNRVRVIRTSR